MITLRHFRCHYSGPLLAAIAWRLFLLLSLGTHPASACEPDSLSYFLLARHWPEAWFVETPAAGAAALFPPLYPLFLRLFGPMALGVQVLLSVAWLEPFGRHLERNCGRRAALIATWFLALDPLAAMMATLFLSESLCAAFLALAIILLDRRPVAGAFCTALAALTRYAALAGPVVTAIRRRRRGVVSAALLPVVLFLALRQAPAAGHPALIDRATDYLLWNAAFVDAAGTAPEIRFQELTASTPPDRRLSTAGRLLFAHPARTAFFYARRLPALFLGASTASFARRLGVNETHPAVRLYQCYSLLHAVLFWSCVAYALSRARTWRTESFWRLLLMLLPAIGPATYGRFRLPVVPDMAVLAAEAWRAPDRGADA